MVEPLLAPTGTEAPRRPGFRVPWILLAVDLACVVAQFATIFASGSDYCDSLDGHILFGMVEFAVAPLPALALFIQQVRSSPGQRRWGQAVSIYLLTAVVGLFVLLSWMPIIFADSC